jgi:hypothetical protein
VERREERKEERKNKRMNVILREEKLLSGVTWFSAFLALSIREQLSEVLYLTSQRFFLTILSRYRACSRQAPSSDSDSREKLFALLATKTKDKNELGSVNTSRKVVCKLVAAPSKHFD